MMALSLDPEVEEKVQGAVDSVQDEVDLTKMKHNRRKLTQSRICATVLERFVEDPIGTLEFLKLKK